MKKDFERGREREIEKNRKSITANKYQQNEIQDTQRKIKNERKGESQRDRQQRPNDITNEIKQEIKTERTNDITTTNKERQHNTEIHNEPH